MKRSDADAPVANAYIDQACSYMLKDVLEAARGNAYQAKMNLMTCKAIRVPEYWTFPAAEPYMVCQKNNDRRIMHQVRRGCLPDLEEAGEGHGGRDGPIPSPLPVHDRKVQNGPPYHARVKLTEVLQVEEAVGWPWVQFPSDEEVVDGVACSQR